MSSGAEKYGKYFWCVKTKSDETIMINADLAEVNESGVLILSHTNKNGDKIINFALPLREWAHFWAASMIDGSAIAVDTWLIDDVETNKRALKQ